MLKIKNNFRFLHCILAYLVSFYSASRGGSFGVYHIRIRSFGSQSGPNTLYATLSYPYLCAGLRNSYRCLSSITMVYAAALALAATVIPHVPPSPPHSYSSVARGGAHGARAPPPLEVLLRNSYILSQNLQQTPSLPLCKSSLVVCITLTYCFKKLSKTRRRLKWGTGICTRVL